VTPPDAAPRGRPSRQRASAVGLLVVAALLFTWPFVRVPRFHVVPAYLHLVAAWALVVAALAAMARAARPRAPHAPARRPGPGDG
jgi:hypothetical protein